MTAGIFLFPAFGGIIAGIALLWIIPLRTLKRRQDRAHETVSTLQSSLDEDASNTEHWRDARFKAAKLDSYNKNLREFIIISTLILALVLSHTMDLSFAGNSLSGGSNAFTRNATVVHRLYYGSASFCIAWLS